MHSDQNGKTKRREIRFRVWDEGRKEFLNPSCFAIRVDGTYDELHAGDGFIHSYNVSRYIVEQFTGLKNKNGVDIFEGDIVGIGRYCGVVALGSFNDSDGYEVVGWHGEAIGDYGPLVLSTDCAMEIMGNIHQHPHLLSPSSAE